GRLVVGVAVGRHKQPMFSLEERVDMIRECVKDLPGVEVETFDGLLVEYARAKDVRLLIRGLRAFSDFEYEFQMALTNRKMAPDVETLFLMPKEEYSYLSSTMVREIARLNGNIENFVPPRVLSALREKYG
ncbi:MAG: pantetheine-phosphate adenylyltransferase, partial [Verrucomicrobiota bacterium]